MDVQKILKEHSIQPRKEWDQYFLQDEKILREEIKAAQLKTADIVLEVGAGVGNLTEFIAEKCKVIAIEKDYSFRTMLRNVNNTNVLFGDALEVLESLRKVRDAKAAKGENYHGEFNKIISNIPYALSQDLILEFLRHPWATAVLIVQKEFAEKLKGKDKLGVLMKECADVKMLRQVPAGAFYPAAVPSAMVLLKQKKQMDDNFWRFLAELYRDRNRDVKNVVKDYPIKIARKKIHQLTQAEVRKLYELNKDRLD